MKLIIEDDEGRKTVVPIIREDVEITIGRQEGNTIRLTERNVSRKHAKLVRREGVVFIEDLGSYTGVRVNGGKISQTCRLKQGDLVQIGDYDLAIVEAEAASTAVEQQPSAGAPAELDGADLITEVTEAGPMPLVPPRAAQPAAPAPSPQPGATARGKYENTAIINPAQVKANRPRRVVDIAAEEAPRLVILTGELAGREFACIRTEIKIGRTEDNDIAIDHRSLSRNHCKVVREESGQWKVLDLNSSNGVKVDGEQYAECNLRFGSLIELGHLKLRFVAAGEAVKMVPVIATQGPNRALVFAIAGLVAVGVIAGGFFLLRSQPAEPPVIIDTTNEPEPDKAAPDPVDPAESGARLVERAKEMMAEGQFAEAERALTAAKGTGASGADELLAAARVELEAQRKYEAAQKAFASGKLAAAKEALSDIPSDSHFSLKAHTLLTQIAAASQLERPEPKPDPKANANKANKAEEAWRGASVPADKAVAERPAVEPREVRDNSKDKEAGEAKPTRESKRQQAAGDLAIGKSLASNVNRKYRDAIPYLERALKSDPRLAEAHLYLGTCYARLEEIKTGAYHYEEFVHLRPDDPQAPKVRQILREYFKQSGEKPRWTLPED